MEQDNPGNGFLDRSSGQKGDIVMVNSANQDRKRSALGWLVVVIGWAAFLGGLLMPLKYLLVKGTLLAIARVLP